MSNLNIPPTVFERLQQRALHEPALAAWFAGLRRDHRFPSIDDALQLVEWYADALNASQAALTRAEQLRPYNVTMICESPECSTMRALKRKAAEASPCPGTTHPAGGGSTAAAD